MIMGKKASPASVNRQMIGLVSQRIDTMNGLQAQLNVERADPNIAAFYNNNLQGAQAEITESKAGLEQELTLRRALDDAYSHTTMKPPEGDPAVKSARANLKEHQVSEKYKHLYSKSEIANPCVRCIEKKLKITFPPALIRAAQRAQKATSVPASVSLAQWAHESGYGKRMPAKSNNPFGIKAGKGEASIGAGTYEIVGGKRVDIVAKFRKFDSIDEAFEEHGRFIASKPAFKQAMAHKNDANEFADALTGTYATDPQYGTLLQRIMRDNDLYRFDASE